MKLALMLLFCAAAVINVVSCAANRQKPRRISKALLMPLLIAVYLTTAPSVSYLVAAGLFCGFLGDVFLIKPGDEKMFALGLGSFAVGHILYIIAIVRTFAIAPPIWSIILMPMVFLAAVLALYFKLRPKLGDIKIPALCYIILLALVAALGSWVWLSGCAGGIYLFLGALFFLISDGVLAVQTFTVGDPAPKYDLTVMLTYIAAQALIATAFILA